MIEISKGKSAVEIASAADLLPTLELSHGIATLSGPCLHYIGQPWRHHLYLNGNACARLVSGQEAAGRPVQGGQRGPRLTGIGLICRHKYL